MLAALRRGDVEGVVRCSIPTSSSPASASTRALRLTFVGDKIARAEVMAGPAELAALDIATLP